MVLEGVAGGRRRRSSRESIKRKVPCVDVRFARLLGFLLCPRVLCETRAFYFYSTAHSSASREEDRHSNIRYSII